MEETITRIEQYLQILNAEIDNVDNDLVDFCINEILDRVQLYLNREDIPTKLERIIAQIINTSIKKCVKNAELSTEVDKAVSSMSDNGQSISYTNEITRYFTMASDEEIFSGFTSLLNRYRRIKVVYPQNVQR